MEVERKALLTQVTGVWYLIIWYPISHNTRNSPNNAISFVLNRSCSSVLKKATHSITTINCQLLV